MIINPRTGRSIKLGGSLYVKLVQIGVINNILSNIENFNENPPIFIDLPHEIILEEIAIHFKLHTLRALCTTNIANSKVCYDYGFLMRWSYKNPDESSLMMEWIASRKKWYLMSKLMHDVVWDASSKTLALAYLLEDYDTSSINMTNNDLVKIYDTIYTYLSTYANKLPTIIDIGIFGIFLNRKLDINELKIYSDYLKDYVLRRNPESNTVLCKHNFPILYVGDFLLNHLPANSIKELFAHTVKKCKPSRLMIAIMASLSNKGRIEEIIELCGLLQNTHTDIRLVIITYANKDTYLALKKKIIGTISYFRDLKHRDLVLYLMEKRMDISTFWDADPCAFSASEYVDLALKYQLKYSDVCVNKRLVSVLYDLLIRGNEYKARELSAELKRRDMFYKYDWDNEDPLTIWERDAQIKVM